MIGVQIRFKFGENVGTEIEVRDVRGEPDICKARTLEGESIDKIETAEDNERNRVPKLCTSSSSSRNLFDDSQIAQTLHGQTFREFKQVRSLYFKREECFIMYAASLRLSCFQVTHVAVMSLGKKDEGVLTSMHPVPPLTAVVIILSFLAHRGP